MTNNFEPLDGGEVLSVGESAQILIGHHTFRVGELAEAIRTQLKDGLGGSSWTEEKDGWFSQTGIDCEVLRFSSRGWQKGKVRISLEFSPEQPEPQVETPPKTSVVAEKDDLIAEQPQPQVVVPPETSVVAEKDDLIAEQPQPQVVVPPKTSVVAEKDDLIAEQPQPQVVVPPETSVVAEKDDLTAEQPQPQVAAHLETNFFEEQDDFIEISPSYEAENNFEEVEEIEILQSNEDEDDLGDLLASPEDEPDFPELLVKNNLGESEEDLLLDDVWKDMNEPTWS